MKKSYVYQFTSSVNDVNIMNMFQNMFTQDLSKQWSPTFLASGTNFVEDNFSMGQGRGRGWFQDASSASLLLCTLFLLLSHHLHLRESGIRSQRLGTPTLKDTALGSTGRLAFEILEWERRSSRGSCLNLVPRSPSTWPWGLAVLIAMWSQKQPLWEEGRDNAL